jgi:hypothetical protein
MVAERAAGPGPTGRGLDVDAFGAVLAFERMIDGLRGIGSVAKIVRASELQPHRPRLDIWVLMPTENIEDEKRVYRLERAYRQVPGTPPVDVHVLFMDQASAPRLPSHQVIFERA